MNYDEIVNTIMHGEKIDNLSLRVTYYCRVSTDSDVQLNSLDNQLSYYENYIKMKTKWTYVKGYVEQGVTGVRIDKRPEFKRMMNDAINNKFDLIITKEASRFARDLEDSIHSIRELKKVGVGVYFESQSLNTFDPNSELVLNIMFNLAQEESKKLSTRVKFGHKQAIKNGHVLGSSNITGYKKDKCKLVIVEEEAKFIKLIYELYATGEYGLSKLGKKLFEMGYTNKKNHIYDKDSLKRMISNPKYKGYYRAHTYEIMDYRTKRRIKIAESEQIIKKCIDDSVPPIVTVELWDKANKILTSRTKSYQNNNHWSGGLKYALSSKIYCKEHNINFQRATGNKRKNRPTWSCGLYLQYRLSSCSSPIIAEKDFYNIMQIILDKILPQKDKLIINMLTIYSNISIDNNYDLELNEINKNIEYIESKKSNALDLILKGILTKESLKIQFKEFDSKISSLNKKKNNIIKQINIINQKQEYLDKIEKAIRKEINEDLLEAFIRKFVDEIIVSKIGDDRNNIKLDIYLDLKEEERIKIKGSKYINNYNKNNIIYLVNQIYETIETKHINNKKNKFTYNVYLKSL